MMLRRETEDAASGGLDGWYSGERLSGGFGRRRRRGRQRGRGIGAALLAAAVGGLDGRWGKVAFQEGV